MKNIFLFAIILFICWACNTNINITMPTLKKQLVIDGWIENGGYPMVILTYNTPFFSNLDSASLRNLVASRAKVTVSDGINSEVLTLMHDTNYFPPYIYEGNVLKGSERNTYYLTVEDEIGTVHATTTIPDFPPVIDSLWMSFINNNDTLGILKGRLSDDPNEKNYYRTFTKNGKSNYIPTLFSCFSDKDFNGQSVVIGLNKGNTNQLKPISNIYFRKGDSIILKVSAIDEPSYNFWVAYQEAVLSTASPFSSDHNQLISNIDNGLGIWCGYNSIYKGLIAK